MKTNLQLRTFDDIIQRLCTPLFHILESDFNTSPLNNNEIGVIFTKHSNKTCTDESVSANDVGR